MLDFQFFFFFLLIFLAGISTILSSNPVHSILNLILIFFLSSCFSLFLGLEFLALLILIVYVGAISVLFLFIVMLLNIRIIELNESIFKYWWLGCLYGLFFAIQITCIFYMALPSGALFGEESSFYFMLNSTIDNYSNIELLGELLFIYYTHLFMFASLILFVAIIGPIVLTFIEYTGYGVSFKKQDIYRQTLRNSFEEVS